MGFGWQHQTNFHSKLTNVFILFKPFQNVCLSAAFRLSLCFSPFFSFSTFDDIIQEREREGENTKCIKTTAANAIFFHIVKQVIHGMSKSDKQKTTSKLCINIEETWLKMCSSWVFFYSVSIASPWLSLSPFFTHLNHLVLSTVFFLFRLQFFYENITIQLFLRTVLPSFYTIVI